MNCSNCKRPYIKPPELFFTADVETVNGLSSLFSSGDICFPCAEVAAKAAKKALKERCKS